MERESKYKQMQRLETEVAACTQCRLHESRLNTVPGEGSLNSPVVFIGEGPGRKEDEAGRPFVGSAGKLLTSMLEKVGLKREDVYIANIVKCRPPKNRRPRSDEVEACNQFLDRQLSLIAPSIIAPMGNSSVSHILKKYKLRKAPIGDIHGSPFTVNAAWGEVKIFPLYHPAAVLYNRSLESELVKDFTALRKMIKK